MIINKALEDISKAIKRMVEDSPFGRRLEGKQMEPKKDAHGEVLIWRIRESECPEPRARELENQI